MTYTHLSWGVATTASETTLHVNLGLPSPGRLALPVRTRLDPRFAEVLIYLPPRLRQVGELHVVGVVSHCVVQFPQASTPFPFPASYLVSLVVPSAIMRDDDLCYVGLLRASRRLGRALRGRETQLRVTRTGRIGE